jgi:hypothetical protein
MTQANPKAAASAASQARPDSREVENENLRPGRDGEPPRPATEPVGAAPSSRSSKARTDPGSGLA